MSEVIGLIRTIADNSSADGPSLFQSLDFHTWTRHISVPSEFLVQNEYEKHVESICLLTQNDPFNVANSNNHICLIPQIESIKGVENAEAIAAVPGISALMFGSGDFLIDAGADLNKALTGEPEPILMDALGKFGAAAAKNNLPIFGGAMSPEMIPMLMQSGYRAIAVQFDVWGFTRMVEGALVSGRDMAKDFADKAKKTVPEGQGKPE